VPEPLSNREVLEVDILIVGGGPAGMSAALRLAQLQREKGGEPLAIAVLEKARDVGAHMLSGAVLDPSALRLLVPDFVEKGAPLASEVHQDHVYFLTRSSKLKFPITPPPLRNHGHYIISLNRFVKWLGGLVESEGVDIFTGFPAVELLYEGDRIAGVRTGDRGVGKHGEHKSTFEPGVDIRAKVTILTDGARGSLTKAAVRRLALDAGRSPQLYAIGIKELWEIRADRMPAGLNRIPLEHPMNQRLVLSSALASVLAMGLASTAAAADAPAKEKCYGVAKAGQNDCANLSGSHTCAGQAKVDKGVDEWVYLKAGTCKDMKGLSEADAKAKTKKS